MRLCRELACAGPPDCKPVSVPLAGRQPFLSTPHCCGALATYPGLDSAAGRRSSPIWSCSTWGLPCHPGCPGRGALLPHLFTLTPVARGGMFSVALSVNRPLRAAPRPLAGTLPCGDRTLLPGCPERLPVRRTRIFSVADAGPGGVVVTYSGSGCCRPPEPWLELRYRPSPSGCRRQSCWLPCPRF